MGKVNSNINFKKHKLLDQRPNFNNEQMAKKNLHK